MHRQSTRPSHLFQFLIRSRNIPIPLHLQDLNGLLALAADNGEK